jgi:hypothetical protein
VALGEPQGNIANVKLTQTRRMKRNLGADSWMAFTAAQTILTHACQFDRRARVGPFEEGPFKCSATGVGLPDHCICAVVSRGRSNQGLAGMGSFRASTRSELRFMPAATERCADEDKDSGGAGRERPSTG